MSGDTRNREPSPSPIRAHRRRRAEEFKKFLIKLGREVPRGLDVRLVLDNCAAHETTAFKTWLPVHKTVQALEKDIRAWSAAWSTGPDPSVWTKTTDEILQCPPAVRTEFPTQKKGHAPPRHADAGRAGLGSSGVLRFRGRAVGCSGIPRINGLGEP
ncbi:hypothetical protein [Streptomyces viridosporus]|uniref:hypothetical protein n=1 Tax=Streptomyces viridosporus TaxID=67581 RepID=UPI0036FAFE8E